MRSGGLPYYGGKNPRRDLTRWIVSQLPFEHRSLYVEPFFGMGGVLLSRAPTSLEIANDINDRLANWWTVLRDSPDEFGRRLDWTPQNCRTEFERSLAALDDDDPIARAVAFTVVVLSSIWHSDADEGSRYRANYSVRTGAKPSWGTEDVMRLRERTRNLQIESVDAIELLDRLVDIEEAVVYCDPPYRSADTSLYRFVPDWDALEAVLKAQRGKVAVSGYGSDWDCLGWRSEELPAIATVYNEGEQSAMPRVERLWMNYEPWDRGLFA